MKRVDTTYGRAAGLNGASSTMVAANIVPTDVQTTVYPSGKVSLVHNDYDYAFGTNGPMAGSVVAVKDYDWGQGAPGALLRAAAI